MLKSLSFQPLTVILFGMLALCIIMPPSGRASDAPSALVIQADLVKSCIETRNSALAKAACDDLRSQFSSDAALPKALLDIARVYREEEYYPAARALCGRVLQDFPASSEALAAWVELAEVERRAGGLGAASDALDGYKAAFIPSSASPEQLLEAVRVYREFKRRADARILCNMIVQKYPDSPETPRVWAELAVMEMVDKNESAAAGARDLLKVAFGSDRGLAGEINRVAAEYMRLKRYDAAREMYQCLLAAQATPDFSVEAEAGLARAAIAQDNRAAAQAAVAALLKDFRDRPKTLQYVYEIARECRAANWAEDSLAWWKELAGGDPAEFYALRSQVALATEYLARENESASDADVAHLLDAFSENAHFMRELQTLSKNFAKLGRNDKVLALNERFLSKWPNHPKAIQAESFVIQAHLQMGNKTAADEATSALLARYKDDPRLAAVHYQIGHRLRKEKNFEDAKPFLDYSLEKSPDEPEALAALAQLAIARVMTGDEDGERVAVARMIADFPNHKDLYRRLLWVAEEYVVWGLKGLEEQNEVNRRFSRIREILNYIIENQPDPDQMPVNCAAHFYLCYCAYRMREWEEVIRLYDAAAARWPFHKNLSRFRDLASAAYIGLARSGKMSYEDARAGLLRIREAENADPYAPGYMREVIDKKIQALEEYHEARIRLQRISKGRRGPAQ